jgi:hypothetical protein
VLTAVFEYLVVAVWPVMLVGSLGRLVLDLLRRRIGASLALTKCCAPRLLGLPFEYREGRSINKWSISISVRVRAKIRYI